MERISAGSGGFVAMNELAVVARSLFNAIVTEDS